MSWIRVSGLLVAALSAAGAIFLAGYWGASRMRSVPAMHSADDLAWLGREFHLGEAELSRIRPLHEGYQTECAAMCDRIAAKNRELAAALDGATNVSPAIERMLGDIAVVRAECQARMLRHFQSVAGTMPREQGARYLAEMQRLTLGLGPVAEHPGGHLAHGRP